jgi:hypothetical protein
VHYTFSRGLSSTICQTRIWRVSSIEQSWYPFPAQLTLQLVCSGGQRVTFSTGEGCLPFSWTERRCLLNLGSFVVNRGMEVHSVSQTLRGDWTDFCNGVSRLASLVGAKGFSGHPCITRGHSPLLGPLKPIAGAATLGELSFSGTQVRHV